MAILNFTRHSSIITIAATAAITTFIFAALDYGITVTVTEMNQLTVIIQ